MVCQPCSSVLSSTLMKFTYPATSRLPFSESLRSSSAPGCADVEILRDSGLELEQRIENLLSFSTWQQSKGQLTVGEFDLGSVIDSIVDNHRMEVVTKKLKIRKRLKEVVLLADREKVRMAVDNLVSNAVKYSPVGGSIGIRVARKAKQVVVDIMDEGPGIPSDERERIFEPFFQGRMPTGRHVRGTGIGLSVVYECVEAHGGNVGVRVRPTGGSHFRMTIPVNCELRLHRHRSPTPRGLLVYAPLLAILAATSGCDTMFQQSDGASPTSAHPGAELDRKDSENGSREVAGYVNFINVLDSTDEQGWHTIFEHTLDAYRQNPTQERRLRLALVLSRSDRKSQEERVTLNLLSDARDLLAETVEHPASTLPLVRKFAQLQLTEVERAWRYTRKCDR